MAVISTTRDLRFLDILAYPEINLAERSFSFLTGESGCGKSTYLRLLNATLLPSAGEILFCGQPIKSLPVLPYRRDVLLVPQEVFLFDGTIEDNFHSYCDARGKSRLTGGEMEDYLRICCAPFPLTAQCRTLSGGERQRVFLAVFLSCLPKVLLLDEPTAALDEKTSAELLSNVKQFCKEHGITALCVCHNSELVNRFADAVIRLEGRA